MWTMRKSWSQFIILFDWIDPSNILHRIGDIKLLLPIRVEEEKAKKYLKFSIYSWKYAIREDEGFINKSNKAQRVIIFWLWEEPNQADKLHIEGHIE